MPDLQLEKMREDSKSDALATVIAAWQKQHKADMDLRANYAKWLVQFLVVQAAVMNVLFILLGMKWLHCDEKIAQIFVTGVFAECVALVWAVVNYLFQNNNKDVFELIRHR